MKILSVAFIVSLGAIALVACGGGSSSTTTTTADTPVTPAVASFTSWSATTANIPVAMTNGSSSSIDLLGSISQADSNGSASAALGDTLQSSFSSANTTTLNKSQTTIGLFANPFTYSFDYQTYGTWGPYGNATGSSFALSDGTSSAASVIPATGSLTYTGGSTGYYVDPNKFSYITNANMVFISTFDNRTLNFSTSNTVIQGGPNGNLNSNPALQLTGVLTYVAGTNNFTGTVTTTSGMTGTMNGKFYGPGLNEVGGTYAVYAAGIGTMVGSFGGKR